METRDINDDDHRHHFDQRSKGHDHRRKTNFLEEDSGGGEFDVEIWNSLSSEIERVQSLLDQNSALIQQVDQNHMSKIPDKLAKNVELIREIDPNICEVLSIYSDLSVDFTDMVHQWILSSKNRSDGGKQR